MATATCPRTRRQPTEAQKQAAAEKRARMQTIISKLAAMQPEERSAIAHRLPIVKISGEPYSVANACLIAFQGGHSATILGGFSQWIKQGRAVKKGEHGFSVWVPIGRKTTDEATGETATAKTGFVLGTVFDVSQTTPIEAK